MGFTRRLRYFLVHQMKISNSQAQQLMDKGCVLVNGLAVSENILLHEYEEIRINGKMVRPAKQFLYLAFYKPRGFESSLNEKVKDNLSDFFSEYRGLAIAGRLDKDSEGLLILSNNGKWIEMVTNPAFEKEKEYEVELDAPPTTDFFRSFREGVWIGNYLTKPCTCAGIQGSYIRVILREGKNRQIRKMCKTLGYNVLQLKRVRVDRFVLGNLQPGKIEILNL